MEAINRIGSLRFDDKTRVKKIACIHQKLLPNSPVVGLGTIFMEMFYYSLLIKSSLIVCDYYQHDDDIAGFIAYTTDPDNFMKKGIKKHFVKFCFILSRILIRDPRKINHLFSGSQLEQALKSDINNEAAILSFGVLPKYRTRRFINKTKAHISNELFEHSVNYLSKKKCHQIRLLIEQDNREAIFFYMQYGCTFKEIRNLGRTLVQATYHI